MGGGAETDQDAHGQGGVQELPSARFPSEILFLHGHQQAGDDHQGRRAVPEVQRPGEVLEEVPAVEEHLAVARGRGQEVQADEREPDERQGAGAFPAQEPGHGPEQVGPSDQPEDAPPAGPDQAAALGAVGEGEADEEDDSCRPEPFSGLELFRPGVPDEEEAQHHQQDEEPLPAANPGGHAAFGIDDEHAHHQQGEGPGEDVAEGFLGRDQLLEAALDGVGDGQAHDEEEQREDDVRQAHGILVRPRVLQPAGHVPDRPEVVHEDHQEHREPPEHVDGAVAPPETVMIHGGGEMIHGLSAELARERPTLNSM